MGLRFSESAIKASFLVENPNWYLYRVAKITKKPSEKGDSDNYFVTFEGQNGEMQGVPVTLLLNSKADWLWIPLFQAANNGVKPEKDHEYEPQDLIDCFVEGYTKRGERQDGTSQNSITEWAPRGTNLH